MNLDDLLGMAAGASPSRLETARARRFARRIRDEYAKAEAEGRDLIGDLDLRDPLAADSDEAARITRAARMAKLGTFTWIWAGQVDAERVTWSEEMSLILGYPPGAVRPSKRLLLELIHDDDRARFCEVLNRAWNDRTVEEITYRIARPDGHVRYVQCRIEVVADNDGVPSGVIGTGQDVTNRELARWELERLTRRQKVLTTMADRDPVTGLHGRARFTDEVDRAMRVGSGVLVTLAIEPVTPPETTTSSTSSNDPLMAAASTVVRALVPSSDLLGRVGAGEIGVLLRETSMPIAGGIVRNVVENLRTQRFVIRGKRVCASAWGGLVRYDMETELNGLDLLIDAETAWRRARARDTPYIAFAEPASVGRRRETWRNRIRTGLDNNRFTLHAQPIREVVLNQTTRHEILLRLLDDTNRAVPPASFLDIAERVDEVLSIDLWVVQQTMRLLSSAPDTTHYHVNLSGRSLGDPRLLPRVKELVREYQIQPAQLTFEITETAVIGNMTQARRFADEIRELGCELALDDFGSGYGSFTYLKYFPIDVVKIDGGFVSGLEDNKADQVMVKSLIEVCRELGIRTAAEFVEHERTMNMLCGYGVDFVQGYAVGEPMPIARPQHTGSATRPARQPRPADPSAVTPVDPDHRIAMA